MIQAFADLLSGGSRAFVSRMFLRFGFLSVCFTPEVDLHGFGSYLLAGAEIGRLQSKERRSQ